MYFYEAPKSNWKNKLTDEDHIVSLIKQTVMPHSEYTIKYIRPAPIFGMIKEHGPQNHHL